MRVLVHGLVGTNLGGIETFLLNMNDFMSDDCIFDYVVEEDSCIHEERIKKKGGRIFYVRSRSISPIGNTIDLIKIYKKYKKDYKTLYYNLSSLSWILPEIIGRFMRFNVVIHSHNAMLIDANSGFVHRNMNKLNKLLLAHMKIKRLACSNFASEFMFGNKESVIIYNGIDIEKYKYSKEKKEIIRRKYEITEDSFVVGSVGRLAYQKNPLFTLKIFNEIQKHIPNSKLLMFGEGDLRSEIEQKVKEFEITDKVLLPGLVSNICDVLNAMDVFLLPSFHEGLGIALIEAQANGLLCFTSKNVVPEEAKVTDLLNYLELTDFNIWIDEILNSHKKYTRELSSNYNELVMKSNYDIRKCAKLLEKCL